MPIHPPAPKRRENSGEKPLIQLSSGIAWVTSVAARNARISSRRRPSAVEKAGYIRLRGYRSSRGLSMRDAPMLELDRMRHSLRRARTSAVLVLALLVQSAPAVPCSSLGRAQGPDVIAATAPVTDVLAIPAERTNGVVAVRTRDRLPEREPAR